MNNVPAAHGAAYDSFTNTIILMGSGSISQVNPLTGLITHTNSSGGGTFDQGAVDGQGHIFAANNDGNLTFIDISGSGDVAAPNFISTQFLAGSLDDVAPLSGLGANPAPEPASMTLLGFGALGLAGYSWRRRKKAAALAS